MENDVEAMMKGLAGGWQDILNMMVKEQPAEKQHACVSAMLTVASANFSQLLGSKAAAEAVEQMASLLRNPATAEVLDAVARRIPSGIDVAPPASKRH